MSKGNEKKEMSYLAMMGVPVEKQGRLYHFQKKALLEGYVERFKQGGIR